MLQSVTVMINTEKEVNSMKAASKPATTTVRVQKNVLQVLDNFLTPNNQLVALTPTQFISQAILEKIEKEKAQVAGDGLRRRLHPGLAGRAPEDRRRVAGRLTPTRSAAQPAGFNTTQVVVAGAG